MSLAAMAQAATATNGARLGGRAFQLQAYISNPVECDTNDRGNLVESQFQRDRQRVRQTVRKWLRAGYWVEVFDGESFELVAGPFDPDLPVPVRIVWP